MNDFTVIQQQQRGFTVIQEQRGFTVIQEQRGLPVIRTSVVSQLHSSNMVLQ